MPGPLMVPFMLGILLALAMVPPPPADPSTAGDDADLVPGSGVDPTMPVPAATIETVMDLANTGTGSRETTTFWGMMLAMGGGPTARQRRKPR